MIKNTLYKEQVSVIVDYIGTDKKQFDQLMSLFFSDDNRLAQRAAWVMSHCVEKQPKLATPYLEKLIKHLYRSNEDAIKRNSLRILQYVEIPKPLWGETLEKCFEYLESNNEAIAIRAFSMTVAYNISQQVPELKPELKALIEEIIIFGSAGLKSRGNKILRKLEKEI
jgi:predicted RNA methylase